MTEETSHCSPLSPLTEAVALEGVVEVLWLVKHNDLKVVSQKKNGPRRLEKKQSNSKGKKKKK